MFGLYHTLVAAYAAADSNEEHLARIEGLVERIADHVAPHRTGTAPSQGIGPTHSPPRKGEGPGGEPNA